MPKTLINDYATYELVEGILKIRYSDNIVLDLSAAVYVVKDRLLIHEGRSLPVLCDIRGIKEISKPARKYLSMEGSTLISAVAFIVDSPVSIMLSKFYLRTSKPPIPNESFESVEAAISFLNEYKRRTD